MKTTVSVQKLLCRLCAALCAFAFLFAWMPATPARAEDSAASAAAILKITNGTDEAYYPAVVLDLGGVASCFSFYPDKLQDTSKVEVTSLAGSKYHTVTEQGYSEEIGLVLWEIDDGFENDSVSLPEGNASKEGQNCILLFLNSDTSKLDITQDVILGEVYNQDARIVSISGVSGDSVYYPAALVDGGGNIVGVALSNTLAYIFKYTASTSPSSGGSGTSSSGSSASAPRPRTDSGNKTPLYFAVGIAVIAVIAVVAVLFLKNKKGGTSAKKTNNTVPHIDVTPDDDKTAFFPTEPTDNITIKPAPVPQQQTLWLAATSGYMMGRVYPMENHEITIGRSPTASVPYEDNSVSKQHCKLYKNASGQWMLMDCNSRNGTYLERIGKLSPMQPVEVYPGDTFYLGSQKHGFTIKNN